MLGANMKSEILVESRCRSEGRQCLQRRRSTKSSHENIEFDPDLALAIQESLKLAKQTGTENKDPGLKFENRTANTERKEILEENNPAQSRVDMESKMETRQLKDMLLLHIDLIQHQQEQLIQKDREIGTLQKEKEALKCRLERMERRMSLVKHKEDSLPQSQAESPHTPTRQDPAQSPSTRTPSHRITSSLDRGLKRKSHLEQQNLSKRFAAVSPRVMPERTWLKTPQHVLLHRPREQLIVSDVERPSIKDQLKELKCHLPSDEEPVLRTDKHYYVSEVCEPPRLSPEKDRSAEPTVREVEGTCTSYNTVRPYTSEPPLSDVSDSLLLLEVPGWRVKTTTRYFNMEGTENLEDEIFLKRHQKPELEEKRRKRWDLQRMREQKQYEKLKQKELAESPKHKASVESFHASLEDVGYIEVSNKLPVIAFGNAIPHLKQLDFQLPWEPQSKPPTNRQTRSRHK